jgi:multidrug efflux pump subunit AcrA (membrane-fusion protein)
MAARYASGFDDACTFLRDSEAAHAAELEEERKQAEAERTAKERELEQAKALAEAQRQRADEQAAARIQARRATWVMAAILALALGAAGFGWHQMRLAQTQSKVALAYLAISGSYRAAREDASLGGLLALQGLSLARSVNDRTARLKAADQVRRAMNSRLLWSSPPGDDVNAIAFTPDGRHLAAASGKLLRLWDVETGGEEKPIEHDADVKAEAAIYGVNDTTTTRCSTPNGNP